TGAGAAPERVDRRDLALPGALVASGLTPPARAALPGRLLNSTVRASLGFVGQPPTEAAFAWSTATTLAEGGAFRHDDREANNPGRGQSGRRPPTRWCTDLWMVRRRRRSPRACQVGTEHQQPAVRLDPLRGQA